jgi:hypothetical protein
MIIQDDAEVTWHSRKRVKYGVSGEFCAILCYMIYRSHRNEAPPVSWGGRFGKKRKRPVILTYALPHRALGTWSLLHVSWQHKAFDLLRDGFACLQFIKSWIIMKWRHLFRLRRLVTSNSSDRFFIRHRNVAEQPTTTPFTSLPLHRSYQPFSFMVCNQCNGSQNANGNAKVWAFRSTHWTVRQWSAEKDIWTSGKGRNKRLDKMAQ